MKQLLVATLALSGCLSGTSAGPTEPDTIQSDTAHLTPDAEPDSAPAPDTVAEPDSAPEPDTAPAPDTTAETTTEPPGPAVVADAETDIAPFAKISASIDWQGHPPSDIQSVSWTVVPPIGPAPAIAHDLRRIEFEANFVGPYLIEAVITDPEGTELVARSFTINVVPPNGFYIQLSWRTPGDSDETDTGGDQYYFSAGSDVDLHFLHPKADGVYFDLAYDCYWDHRLPEWGIFDPLDNPSLDRDDTDGVGPEAVTLATPEPGVTYSVGVHY